MAKAKVKQTSIIQKTQIVLDTDEAPIIWVKDFNYEAAQKFIQRIIELDSDPDVPQIYVFISSNGGYVYSVFAMIEAMKHCNKPVHTVGLGMCASCAAVLLSCGTGKRWITKDSFMHIHNISSGTYGNIEEMEQDLANSKVIAEKLMGLLAADSNMSLKELKEKISEQKREWLLSSATAKKFGFIDEIGMPSLKRYLVVESEE